MQVLNIQVPLIFKDVIDALNIDVTPDSTVWVVVGSLVLGCKSFFYVLSILSVSYIPEYKRWCRSYWVNALW